MISRFISLVPESSLNSSLMNSTSFLVISNWLERLTRISNVWYPSPVIYHQTASSQTLMAIYLSGCCSSKSCPHFWLLFLLYPVFNLSAILLTAFKHAENLRSCHFYAVITPTWRYFLASLPASFFQIVLSIAAEGILLKTCPPRIKILIWTKCGRPDWELQGPVLSAPSSRTSRSHLLLLFPFLTQLQARQLRLRTLILTIDSPLSASP